MRLSEGSLYIISENGKVLQVSVPIKLFKQVLNSWNY